MSSKEENKQTILIVDDSEMNRSILSDMLDDEFDLIEAADGIQAVAQLQKRTNEISLVLLDIVMPEMDGFEVLAVMNQCHWIDDVPVIMISAENSPSYIERAYELGVTDFISRPFDALIVHRRVVNTIMLYAKQRKLIGLVAEQIYEKEKNSSLMISILSHIVEFHNGESGLHVLHINTLTELLLRALVHKTNKYHLTRSEVSLITVASALHDIGKISISGDILNKPGRLTKEEFEIMKTHTIEGAKMLEALPFHQNEPLVKIAYEICRWHHERYDGRGYPDGLVGEQIPISAQVVSLADVYDALTSVRVYKPALSHQEAMKMIINNECGVFNPLLLECLVSIADQVQDELRVNSLSHSNQRDMRNVAEEMLRHEELTASERTLRLLEHERMKYQFFASMSQEIQFEYTTEPPMITISEWGARHLDLPETIMDPLNSPIVLKKMERKTLQDYQTALHTTTPEHPEVHFDCQLNVEGKQRWHKIISRVTWTQDLPEQEGPYVITSVIGKAVDIHEERMHLMNLQKMALYDSLTGLNNQASAAQIIRQELEENPRGQFALGILDIDHFKSVNDTYGHMFGDSVLKHVAHKLRHSMRSNDVSARIGGDEFLIFLEYHSDLNSIIHRIFHALEGEYEGYKITVSLGVAETNVVGRNYEKLYNCADHALYAGKRGGRCQYRFYDPSMEGQLSGVPETKLAGAEVSNR